MMLPSNVRVFVALDPIDMHASFDRLAGRVRATMNLDPTAGHLFVFVNRPRTHLKVLFFERSGYAILYKRLARGTFELPKVDGAGHVQLDPAELAALLEGIDLGSAKRRLRYKHPVVDPAKADVGRSA